MKRHPYFVLRPTSTRQELARAIADRFQSAVLVRLARRDVLGGSCALGGGSTMSAATLVKNPDTPVRREVTSIPYATDAATKTAPPRKKRSMIRMPGTGPNSAARWSHKTGPTSATAPRPKR